MVANRIYKSSKFSTPYMKNHIHHIVLTVSNAARSVSFYQKVLGWRVIEQKNDYGYLAPDDKKYSENKFLLVLGEPRDYKIEGTKFDRNRIGLDHFAFEVETAVELKELEVCLRHEGIEMETGGITDDDFGGTAIFCYDPDGMKVEFHLKK